MSVIIPARDEAANLPHVFGTFPPWVDEVVLVDGGSVDDTVAVSRAAWPKVKVITQPGRGKGDALRAGFAAATGDIIITIDADGSADGAEIVRFVGALVAGADFAKGSRFASSGGSDDITGLRRYGNWVLSVLVNRMFGTRLTDLCYGYNAFWARHLDAVEVSDGPGFEVETLMTIRAIKSGLTIYEVPSHEAPRIFGDSNLHAVKDGWRVLKVIVREWLAGSRTRGARGPAAATSAAAAAPAAPAPASVKTGAISTAAIASIATAPYRMPAFEREGAVSDQDIVAAIAESDATGVAAAFGRYAQDLYTYCRSRLPTHAEAAWAVRDTFIIASATARRLAEPDRLRAWLFALARNECHRRLRDAAPTAAPSARLYEGAQAMDDTGSIVITEQAEFRALVRAAMAGLDPVDREISELNVRHGFYGADLADILGVPRKQAHVLAERARSRFAKSLGVLPVAGWKQCQELKGILDGQGRSHSPGLSPQVKNHIRHCAKCRQRQRIGLNPAILLGLLPVDQVPGGLRRQVMDLATDPTPAGVAYRHRMANRAERFGADGFPEQVTTPSAPGWRVSQVSAAAAAAAALALLAGGMYYAAGHVFTHGGPGVSVVGRSPAPTSGTDPASPSVRASSSPRPGSVRQGQRTANVAGRSPSSKRQPTKAARSRASKAPAPRSSTQHAKSSSSLPVALLPVPLPTVSLPITLPLP